MYYTTQPRVHVHYMVHYCIYPLRFIDSSLYSILHNKFALLNSISFEFALCLYIYSLHFLINIYIIMWIWNWKPWKAYLHAHIKCIRIEQWLYCILGQNGMIIVRKVDYWIQIHLVYEAIHFIFNTKIPKTTDEYRTLYWLNRFDFQNGNRSIGQRLQLRTEMWTQLA